MAGEEMIIYDSTVSGIWKDTSIIIRNILLFSLPDFILKVEAVTGWDFADGAWLHAPSGLIREDNTEKPAYYGLLDLIRNQWTSQGTLQTDENGMALLEGFRGQYKLTVGGAEAAVTLAKDSADRISSVTVCAV